MKVIFSDGEIQMERLPFSRSFFNKLRSKHPDNIKTDTEGSVVTELSVKLCGDWFRLRSGDYLGISDEGLTPIDREDVAEFKEEGMITYD